MASNSTLSPVTISSGLERNPSTDPAAIEANAPNASAMVESPPSSPLTPTPAWVEQMADGNISIPDDFLLGGSIMSLPVRDKPCKKRDRSEEPPTGLDQRISDQSISLPLTGLKITEDTENSDKTDQDAFGSTAMVLNEMIKTNANYVPPKRDVGKANTDDPRLPPPMAPEVYSYYRQALCEALPYYDAYQGSCYSVNCVARGFLVDKEADLRDYLGSQVIITSCGGGRTRDDATGSMVRTKSQDFDSVAIRALYRAMESKTQIGVIISENHPLFAWKPPQSYCVLDWFIITNFWPEKMNIPGTNTPVLVFKFRLEKVDKNKVSWWAPPESDLDALVWNQFGTQVPRCPTQICSKCGASSPEIYTAGWTCLDHKCSEHFKFSEDTIEITKLQYTNGFLAERTDFGVPTAPLRPGIPEALDGFHGTEKIFRKGIVCPNCGLCSSRVHWNRWTCEPVPHGDMRGCGTFKLVTPMKSYPESALQQETASFNRLVSKRRKVNALDTSNPPMRLNVDVIQFTRIIELGSYQACQYLLPDQKGNIIGSITLFPANKDVNSRAGGPDDMLEDVSGADLGLRRSPVALKGKKGQGLTRHFTHNFGAPYKFGVTVDSTGFDQAPECILKALHRLDWAAKVSVSSTAEMINGLSINGDQTPPSERQEYNELLVLGYMTDDHINYHDDGEKNLGPTVATLSLGSPARMAFRPKAAARFPDALVPRVARSMSQDVLEIPILHGDMVVMHGTAIHRLYEHAVKPAGSRRYAMTCRYIDTETMTDDDEIRTTLLKGTIPADSYQWAYDGN